MLQSANVTLNRKMHIMAQAMKKIAREREGIAGKMRRGRLE
jgi:hypothetical protein